MLACSLTVFQRGIITIPLNSKQKNKKTQIILILIKTKEVREIRGKVAKNNYNKLETDTNVIDIINPTISLITLNVKSQIEPIKRQRYHQSA